MSSFMLAIASRSRVCISQNRETQRVAENATISRTNPELLGPSSGSNGQEGLFAASSSSTTDSKSPTSSLPSNYATPSTSENLYKKFKETLGDSFSFQEITAKFSQKEVQSTFHWCVSAYTNERGNTSLNDALLANELIQICGKEFIGQDNIQNAFRCCVSTYKNGRVFLNDALLANELIQICGKEFIGQDNIQNAFRCCVSIYSFVGYPYGSDEAINIVSLIDDSFAKKLIQICGKEFIGQDNIQNAFRQCVTPYQCVTTYRDFGGRVFLNDSLFAEELIKICGKEFIGQDNIQNAFRCYVSIRTNEHGHLFVDDNLSFGETLIKICGKEFIGQDEINLYFTSTITGYSLSWKYSNIAEKLVNTAGDMITAENLITAYRSNACPIELISAIENYVRSNPGREIQLPRRADMHVSQARETVRGQAYDIHHYSNNAVNKAIAKAQSFLLPPDSPKSEIKNIEDLKALINKLLPKDEAKKAEKALDLILNDDYYGEQLIELLPKQVLFVTYCTNGLVHPSSTVNDRLTQWLRSAFVESAEAYGKDQMSCIKGIFERFAISGLRGMWKVIDALLLPSELFRVMPDEVPDPKFAIFLEKNFFQKVSDGIRKRNSNIKAQLESKLDDDDLIPDALLSEVCQSFFIQYLKNEFIKILDLAKYLTLENKSILINLHEKIINSKNTQIFDFCKHAKYIPKFLEGIKNYIIQNASEPSKSGKDEA